MRTKPVVIALFVASVGVLGATLWHNAQESANAKATAIKPETRVLVATNPLGPGTLLRADDVEWRRWSKPLVHGLIIKPPSSLRSTKNNPSKVVMEKVYGAVLRDRVRRDDPILSTKIVEPGDRGFLAAVLAPGFRAITIGVSAVTGTAGLIFPGDHVDVILSQLFNPNQEPLSRRAVSETIVKNLRVLAVDQKLNQFKPNPQQNNMNIKHTVTLEVRPQQAEMLTVASELGNLSLILRSVPIRPMSVASSESPVKEATRSMWAYDVSPALRNAPRRAVPGSRRDLTVRIMRASKVQVVKE